MTLSFLDQYEVLIVEESQTRRDLLSEWINGVSATTVSSPARISDEFESSVVVVCLSQTAIPDDSEALQKYILAQNPYCQILGILPRTSFVSPYEDQFDEILQRPLFKEGFQDAIEYCFISGAYSNLLSELYDLNTDLLAVKRANEDEITDSQGLVDKIQGRCDELRSNLDTLQEKLSTDAILNIIQTIERHNRYLKEPDTDTPEGRGTKHCPPRCPSCKLPWGVNHRNDLGDGYDRLGADVYQCARCEKTVHGLAGDHRVY